MLHPRNCAADADDDALAVGVDLGGTKIEVSLVDRQGGVINRIRRATRADKGPDAVIEEVIACLTDPRLLKAASAPIGIGVGVAGQVDPETGLVRYAPNLRWHNVQLRERLQDRLAVPVEVLNDVQAVTYGEWIHGAGKGAKDLVCLFVGTGVGGGVVADGRLITGCSGNAGELGHLTIERSGPLCSCGNHGCLEALAGGWAIARRAKERIEGGGTAGDAIRRLAEAERAGEITAATVAKAYHQGDGLAREIMEDVGRALGAGIASIANAFNPAVLVLGGGVLDGLPELLDLAEREARARALDAASRPLRIVKAELGPDAGAVGAAARIRDRILAGTHLTPTLSAGAEREGDAG
ncbi:MAG TPA: ROK family protein [Alphaproteobacteria bacterium]|nr:ROK family protein [Alphaproteobacteria bacterium]